MTAGLWIAAACFYVSTEYIAAWAFSPPYSYARNYISDLGVPVCGAIFAGRSICSPLHGLMNADFVLQGAMFLAAALVLSRTLSHPTRYAFIVCAALNGVGNVLVGLFPETTMASAGGISQYHVAGAFLAIVFGNGTALVSAFALKDIGLPRIHRHASIALSLLGWSAIVVLIAAPGLLVPNGVWERLSVYTITIWEVLSATCLMVGLGGGERMAT